jgi:pyridoxamine 5'-phosphate oxidase
MASKGNDSGPPLDIAALRQEYTQGGFSEDEADSNPIRQFENWFQQALKVGLREPNAMVLATVGPNGQPSTRVVLLKDVSEKGFSFFTNYESRKGQELAQNPKASATFPWLDLERQVCIQGHVTRLSREESEAYWKVRPRASRLGAWVSKQSTVISGRPFLEARMQELQNQYPGEDIPLPPYWGGYLLAPEEIEFWQGRRSRLHDRIHYRKQPDNTWKIERLSP